jgi:hypothetical protein
MKSSMGVRFRSVTVDDSRGDDAWIVWAVDDSRGDDAWIVWVSASDSDGFAKKLNIAVAIARVCTGKDNYYIAIIGIINRGLNIVKIRRPIIINRNYSPRAGTYPRQKNNAEKQMSHFCTLQAQQLDTTQAILYLFDLQ